MIVSSRFAAWLRLSSSVAALAVVLLHPSAASAQIKQPGNHPQYSVELEPHLLLQWSYTRWDDDGLGLGGRVSIPVIENGPIRTINNNFAVGFGLDWAHFDNNCYGFYYQRGVGNWDCSADHFWIPAVAQWNFFFTPVVSAFAELGFAIQHASETVGCGPAPANLCGDSSYTRVRPYFAVGPRFHITDGFAITLRIGIPYLSIGGSFFL